MEFVTDAFDENDPTALGRAVDDLRRVTNQLTAEHNRRAIPVSELRGVTLLGRLVDIIPGAVPITALAQFTSGIGLSHLTRVMDELMLNRNDPESTTERIGQSAAISYQLGQAS